MDSVQRSIGLINDLDPRVRKKGAVLSAGLDSKQAEYDKVVALIIPTLIRSLNTEDPNIRRVNASFLGGLLNQENTEHQKAIAPAIPQLITLLLNDQDLGVRRASAKILGKIFISASTELQKTFESPFPQLIALLNARESDARRACVAALGTLADKVKFREAIIPAIPQIIALLSDENSDIRRASLDTLRKLAVQDVLADEFRSSVGTAIQQIVPLLTDSDLSVRIASACLLLELSGHAEFQQALQSSIPQINALLASDVDVLGEHATMLGDVYEQGVNPGMPGSESDIVKYGTETEHIEATTYWIAAEHGLEHARSKISLVSEVFDRWQISTSEYAILAGFDESLIQSGVGYLEQIHIFLSESAEAIATSHHQLLTELGKIFSPFSSVLVTESSLRYLSVFKDDGSVWDFDELIYCGSGSGTGEGEGGNNEKRELEKGKKRNSYSGDEDSADKGGNGDKDPDDNPEDPSGNKGPAVAEPGDISFEINSKIYPAQAYSQNTFQTITMLGSLTIKTTPLSLAERPYQFSERRVQFKGLAFDSTPPTTEAAYRQFHVVVVVDSQQEQGCVARILSITPKTTRASDSEEKIMRTIKKDWSRSGTVSLSVGAVTHGLISGNATKTNKETVGTERKRYSSAITAHRTEGTVRWGFNIDDVNMQTWGIDMGDILPSASFRFHGKLNKPVPPPKSMVTVIASHWSIDLPSEPKRTLIRKLLDRFGSSGNSEAISYSNMFQIVSLKVDTSKLELEPYHYKANLEVRSGNSSFKPLGEVSGVDVTPAVVDDLRKLSHNLPAFGKLKLSDNHTLRKST